MPRMRNIKPAFFTHDILGELPPLHRILFAGLWCYADREGRLEDRPRFLKTVVLPYDDCDVDAMLADLAARGFIVRYVGGGRRLLAVLKFGAHQHPHKDEKPSDLPGPDADDCEITQTSTGTVPAPCEPGASTMAAPVQHHGSTPLYENLDLRSGNLSLRVAPKNGAPAEPAAPSPAPGWKSLIAALSVEFLARRGTDYRFQAAKDGSALSALLKLKGNTHGEILSRWRRGLEHTDKFLRTNTLAQLNAKWNDLADTGPPPRIAVCDIRRGTVRAEDQAQLYADAGESI